MFKKASLLSLIFTLLLSIGISPSAFAHTENDQTNTIVIEERSANGVRQPSLANTGFGISAGKIIKPSLPTGASKPTSPKIHGNSHKTTKPASGYSLRDKTTGEVLKYGETTRGKKRYTNKFYKENNAEMIIEANGTKKEMHKWQHEKILEYKTNNNGNRPPLNKSDY